MTMLNSGFAYCIEKFGSPLDGETFPHDVVERYRGKVPDAMLDFWSQYGSGLWLDGYFQLVRPDRYDGLINVILGDDPDFPSQKSVLIGYSAFGTLLVWNNKNYFLRVDLVNRYAYTRHVNSKHPVLDPDRSLPSTLNAVDGGVYDFIENTDAAKPLFARAIKQSGKLGYGECYGFVPAVGLGGRGVLEEVQRVRALEHFSILAQLGPIELRYMDTERRKIVVLRALGG
ncbi:GAD-like domain-containing protein [Acidiphilium sp. PA]|uniref:GAD-like domain-containing protein n=1 Tax=Acidiphilium sp. PA TaxID=2871705 RepID=UPI002244C252|nr:GAD-like domain-containing protein [Acidiphilium sp. PA]MCW8308660.1 GAD-like domain-containing protein [Acidiphilium sp. PA]